MWKVLGDGQTALYYTLSQERRAIIDFLDVALTPMPPKDIAVLVDGSDDSEKIRKLLYKRKNDDQNKWVEEDKEAGIKGGYVTLIPSPKTKREEENKMSNCVDGVDAVDSIDTVDAVDVYGNYRASTENKKTVDAPEGYVNEHVEPVQEVLGYGASTPSTVSTHLEKNDTSQSNGKAVPPNRPCYNCRVKDWQWDDLLETHICGNCNHG